MYSSYNCVFVWTGETEGICEYSVYNSVLFVGWLSLSHITLLSWSNEQKTRKKQRGSVSILFYIFLLFLSNNTSLSHYFTKRLLTTYVVKNVERYCAMGVGWDYLRVAPGVKMTKWREVWARWRRRWLNVHTTNLMTFIGWSTRATSQRTEWTSIVCDAMGTWLTRCIVQFDRLEWGVGGLLDGAVLGDIRVGMYGIGIPGIGTRGVYVER